MSRPVSTRPSQERVIGAEALAIEMRSAKPPVLVDIREPEEYSASHLPNTVHVPLMNFPDAWDAIKAQAAGRTVVLYCRSGGRTGMLLDSFLAAENYPVVHLVGGLQEFARTVDRRFEPL